jgi:ribonuclease J
MFVTIHRGTRQIGGSCVEVRNNYGAMLIDIGLPLDCTLREASTQEHVKDGVFPDIPGIYRGDTREPSVDAILISHGHLDHYGILPYIKEDIPIVIGSLTWNIIKTAAPFLHQPISHPGPAVDLQDGESFSLAGFTITPFLMDHSAFDAYSFLISDGERTILYSGDFRGHGRKKVLLERFLDRIPKQIDALIIEGTTLSREEAESNSEEDVEKRIGELSRKTKNLVMAYCSSQNIDRIVSLYKAAKATGRVLVIDIYTAHILLAASAKGNRIPLPGVFKDVLVYYPHRIIINESEEKQKELLYRFKECKITTEEIAKKRDSILMLVRPSVLRKLERISDLSEAVLIYSLWEGYQKQDYVSRFLSRLEVLGVQIESVHSSGHADRATLKHVVRSISPKHLIPIHTQEPEKYKEMFSDTILCEDGQVLTI